VIIAIRDDLTTRVGLQVSVYDALHSTNKVELFFEQSCNEKRVSTTGLYGVWSLRLFLKTDLPGGTKSGGSYSVVTCYCLCMSIFLRVCL
jgi:hypothetical protein